MARAAAKDWDVAVTLSWGEMVVAWTRWKPCTWQEVVSFRVDDAMEATGLPDALNVSGKESSQDKV